MELFRALGAIAEPPHDRTSQILEALNLVRTPTDALRADYTELFLFQLYPYASVYLGAEGKLGGSARDRIAGFWRALGIDPPTEPDHIAVMLSLYARLREGEREDHDADRTAARQRARRAFLWEHLLSWMPAYLTKVAEIGPPPYADWGRMLLDVLLAEAQTDQTPQLPLHLRDAPSMPPPSATVELLGTLLTPVRSGIILTRYDLARAASTLGLGLRAGERLFALEALLDQSPRDTVRWMHSFAEAWAATHERLVRVLGETAAFWTHRARTTAQLMRSLEADHSS